MRNYFFKIQKKTKNMEHKSMKKKRLNKKVYRENGVFLMKKRRQKKRVLLQYKKMHIFLA